MTRHHLRFIGQLILESPVAISLPGSGEGLKASDPAPVPVTTVFDPAAGLVDTAYIPASSIRGSLRRAAHAALNRRLRALGREPLDLRSFYLLRIGGIKAKGSSDGLSKDVSAELALRQSNPLVSLFGAADAGPVGFLAGRLEVDHALPVTPLSPASCPAFAAMRSDDVLRSPASSMELLSPEAVDAWQRLFEATNNTSALKKRHKAALKSYGEAKRAGDNAAVEAASAQLKELEETLSSAQGSIAQPLAGYRAIPAGTQLSHTVAMDATLAELGCFLDAIETFTLDPSVGGHRNHGCGRLRAEWEVVATQMGEDGRVRRQPLGTLSFSWARGMELRGEALQALADEALGAWADAVAQGDFAYHPRTAEPESEPDAEDAPAKTPGRRRAKTAPAA